MDKLKPKYCPTQSGTFTAYRAEFRTKDEQEWMKVPITKSLSGVPYPKQFGGIMSTVCLLRYAQANALMWCWAAAAEAAGDEVEVRVVGYEVKYDIKARELLDKTPERTVSDG